MPVTDLSTSCCNQGKRRDIADAMALYVRSEAYDKRQEWWDTDSWPREFPAFPNIPQQQDGSSCGLYAVVLADCMGVGLPLQHCQFSDADAVGVRAQMLAGIAAGTCIDV